MKPIPDSVKVDIKLRPNRSRLYGPWGKPSTTIFLNEQSDETTFSDITIPVAQCSVQPSSEKVLLAEPWDTQP